MISSVKIERHSVTVTENAPFFPFSCNTKVCIEKPVCCGLHLRLAQNFKKFLSDIELG